MIKWNVRVRKKMLVKLTPRTRSRAMLRFQGDFGQWNHFVFGIPCRNLWKTTGSSGLLSCLNYNTNRKHTQLQISWIHVHLCSRCCCRTTMAGSRRRSRTDKIFPRPKLWYSRSSAEPQSPEWRIRCLEWTETDPMRAEFVNYIMFPSWCGKGSNDVTIFLNEFFFLLESVF